MSEVKVSLYLGDANVYLNLNEAEIFLDRDRGRLARNVLAEIKGETE